MLIDRVNQFILILNLLELYKSVCFALAKRNRKRTQVDNLGLLATPFGNKLCPGDLFLAIPCQET